MILTIVNVIYVLVAIAMVALILMQRGAGAAAGSGFGGGASATVFGARGSANFLSTATKWLAVVFFAMSLGMAWSASRGMRQGPATEDIGIMAELPAAADSAPATSDLPAVPAAPAATQASADVPAEATEAVEVEQAPADSATEEASK